jgi:hypothetical protein
VVLAHEPRDSGGFNELGAVADDGQDAHEYDAPGSMIGAGAAKTLVGGAVGVLAAVAAAARHMSWYVRYQTDGTAHDDEYQPAERNEDSPPR